MKTAKAISIKSEEEIAILREGGRILAKIIHSLNCSLKSGITAKQIDTIAEDMMRQYGVRSAFKGYRGFPGSVCVSINEEVVHGIPNERLLKPGDLVSLDAGIIHKGYYTDMAISEGIGAIDPQWQLLMDITKESLYKGIEQARAGNHLSDISYAVQQCVEANHFSVVRDFVGHGIGKDLHEEPEIPNFGQPSQGPILKEGMVLAIEPMVNMGTWKTKISSDGWTVKTEDQKPSAHFEHTIVITSQGPQILTEDNG